jgi:hypothetical protein
MTTDPTTDDHRFASPIEIALGISCLLFFVYLVIHEIFD